MTDTIAHLIPITVPLTASDRSQAQVFAQQQPQSRSKQVYRQTLAVLATHRYLQMLGIRANLEASHFWNPLNRLLGDSADLYIHDVKGYVQCLTVRMGDRVCSIPEEVQSLDFIVVQLDEPYREGQILGFIGNVSVSEVKLSQLQPLDCLIDRLFPQTVELAAWWKQLHEALADGWQPLSRLLQPKSPVIAMASSALSADPSTLEAVKTLYLAAKLTVPQALESTAGLVDLIQNAPNEETRWQAAELLWQIDPEHPACPILKGKDLGLYLNGSQVALIVGILAKSSTQRLILLRLYPLQEVHLPPGLKLRGFDEDRNTLFEIESRQKDDYMQFKLTADTGDRFSIEVVLENAIFVENFIV